MKQPTQQYFNEELGVMVNVYAAKMPKRKCNWMRGEVLLSMKMRIPEDGDRCFVQFTRKNGKY